MNRIKKIFAKASRFIKRKYVFAAILAIMTVIFGICLFNTAMSFVTVGNVEIVGENPYEDQDIRNTAKIKLGKDLWKSLDAEKIEERILFEHKLIEEVEVKREFPNNIVIRVVPKSQRWYMTFNDFKYGLDAELKVTDEVTRTDGLTELVLPNVKTAHSGKVPQFGASDTERTVTLEVIETVRTSKLRSRVTKLDVSNRTDVRMEIDGIYEVHFGGTDGIAAKLKDIELMLESDTVKNSGGGDFYAYGTTVSFQASTVYK